MNSEEGDGGVSGGSGSELADPSGPLWCPSLSGGAEGGSGLWSEPVSSLGFHSLFVRVFFVCGLFLQLQKIKTKITKLHPVSICPESADDVVTDLFSPTFTRLLHFSDGVSLPVSWLALVWSGLVRGGFVSASQSAPLWATRWQWRGGFSFIHSFLFTSLIIPVWSLCAETVWAEQKLRQRSFFRSSVWTSLKGAGGPLYSPHPPHHLPPRHRRRDSPPAPLNLPEEEKRRMSKVYSSWTISRT